MTKPNLLNRWFRPRAAARSALATVASEPWLVQPKQLEAAFSEIREGAKAFTSAPDVRAAMEMADGDAEAARANPYQVHDGVAVIAIHGLIMREVPCAMRFFGTAATSTVETQEALARALEDDEVKAIFLDINSPGGTLAGTAALADDIRSARAIKPVHAHASDLAASAAYWLAAQATTFSAGKTAEIGSIGAYRVLVDSSKNAMDEGFKVYRLASGPHKGVGVPGVEITDEQLKLEQEQIDRAGALFREAVIAGRPSMSADALEKLATGQVWYGVDALGLGLIDAVQSTADAFAEASASAGGLTHNKDSAPISAPTEGNTMPMNTAPAASAAEGSSGTPAAGAAPVSTDLEARLAALEAKNAELAAANEQLQAQVKMGEKGLADRRKTVLDRHQARGAFDPADRPEYERLAAAAYSKDPDGLDAFLGKFESKSHTIPAGALGQDASPSAEDVMPPAIARAAADAGITNELWATAGETAQVSIIRQERTTTTGQVLSLVESEVA